MKRIPKTLLALAITAGIGALVSMTHPAQDAKVTKPPGEQESQAAADNFYQAANVRFSALEVAAPGAQNPTVFAANTIKQIQLVDSEGDGLWLEMRFRNGEYSLQKVDGINFRLRGDTGTSEVLVTRSRKRTMFWPLVN